MEKIKASIRRQPTFVEVETCDKLELTLKE